MRDDCDVPFLTVEEAATVLRVAKRTLDSHRSHKTGPEFRRHGGRIVYRLSDLLAWSEQRAVRTTGPNRTNIPASKDAERLGSGTPAQASRSDSTWQRRANRKKGNWRSSVSLSEQGISPISVATCQDQHC
jgi:hypothetical protein